jgi:hypothetical protein
VVVGVVLEERSLVWRVDLAEKVRPVRLVEPRLWLEQHQPRYAAVALGNPAVLVAIPSRTRPVGLVAGQSFLLQEQHSICRLVH